MARMPTYTSISREAKFWEDTNTIFLRIKSRYICSWPTVTSCFSRLQKTKKRKQKKKKIFSDYHG